MTRLRRLVHTLVAAGLLAAAGCAPPDEQELRLWAMGREGELVQRLLPEFERAHPGVRVRVQQLPWSAAHEKLLTAFVGGSMPDVFQVGTTWIPELVALGALAPLDARLNAGDAADVFPGILEASRVDGRLWAMPWYVDTRLLFYRADLLRAAGFAEPPHDWDGWRRALQGVRAAAGPGRYALLLPLSEWQAPVILALQGGAPLLRGADEWGDFQAPAFRQAFMFYLSFFRDRLAPTSAEGQIANLYQDFADGFFSALITGPWNLSEMAARLPARLQGAWATAPMPGGSAGEPGLSIAGGASLAVHAASPRRDAAWQLVEYLAAPQRQLEFYRLSGDLPARRAAWTAGRLADDPRVAAFWRQLGHVRTPPRVPEWERIATAISRAAEAAVRGDATPDEALARLDREVDAILAKRRWLLARERAEAGT